MNRTSEHTTVQDEKAFPRALVQPLMLAGALAVLVAVGVSAAGRASAMPSATEQRDAAFQQLLKHPRDVDAAREYARLCVEMKDYEGAIGALERVQFYRPDDAELKAQIGLLYYQLHSPQMAKQYLDAASAGELDADTRAKVEAVAPALDTAQNGSHAFAFVQSGARYQTNAAFNPDNNILRLANQDFVFTHPGSSGADWNGFQLIQAGYDYSLGNQRGDTVEARLTGYATEQFRFTNLNIGLYDVSIGPRLAVAPDLLPGWTVKPYVAGGQAFLAGARYFNSEGAGVLADMPLRPGIVVEPGVEVRHVNFNGASAFSSLNSGTTATASLVADVALDATWSFHGRVFYTRDAAALAFQSSSSVAEEMALTARFAPPVPGLAVSWSVSPYAKFLQTLFDAPNPVIDSVTTRHDQEVQVGVILDTPISKTVSLLTNIQFARVDSNIPNFCIHNLSVFTGPTVRF